MLEGPHLDSCTWSLKYIYDIQRPSFYPQYALCTYQRRQQKNTHSRNKFIYYKKSEMFACYKNKNVQSLSQNPLFFFFFLV